MGSRYLRIKETKMRTLHVYTEYDNCPDYITRYKLYEAVEKYGGLGIRDDDGDFILIPSNYSPAMHLMREGYFEQVWLTDEEIEEIEG